MFCFVGVGDQDAIIRGLYLHSNLNTMMPPKNKFSSPQISRDTIDKNAGRRGESFCRKVMSS